MRPAPPLCRAAAVLLVALLAAAPVEGQAAPGGVQLPPVAVFPPFGHYPPPSAQVPPRYVLTNESTLRILDALASHPGSPRAQRAVVFTTLRFGDAPEGEVAGMVASFCSHLHRHGLLQHTLLITTDERTWAALTQRGLPAFLDRAFPRRAAYVERVKPDDTSNREFDVQKHWWGWRLASLGFRSLYLDSDAAVLRDPLPAFEEPFDVQGLSDWENLQSPELAPGAMLRNPCTLYYAVQEERMPTGTIWRESFRIPPGTPAFIQNCACQSTGLWFLQPTNATVAFMAALVDRIAYHAPYQWDQTAWNELIIPQIFGMGDYPPLRYRLLPFYQFSNIGTHRARKAKGMALDPVALHLGGVHGPNKTQTWIQENLYAGDFNATLLGLKPREGDAGSGGGSAGAGLGHGWYEAEGRLAVRLDLAHLAVLTVLVPAAVGAASWVARLRRRGARGAGK